MADEADDVWLSARELGKNLDGLRVLKGAQQSCPKLKCRPDIEAKLRIYGEHSDLVAGSRMISLLVLVGLAALAGFGIWRDRRESRP